MDANWWSWLGKGWSWHWAAGAGHRLITNHPFITGEAGLGWEGESWEQNKLLSVCRGRRSIKRDQIIILGRGRSFTLQLLLPRKPAMGCKKGGKCRKAPRLCLKSLSCGNKNYKVHVAIDMSIVHCTCVLCFLWHWCLYISFCNFQRGSFAWSFLQPRNILSCVKLKRKYHKI